MKYFLCILCATLLFSCGENNLSESVQNSFNSQEIDNSKSYWEYFYPIDSIEPYIYGYQDANNPIDERLHRFIVMEDDDGDSVLIIERYNSNFRIFEGFTLNILEDFKIKDHMMVDKDGIKRSSRLSKTQYFPKNLGDQSIFLADFPSHIDSVIMFYESKKHIDETDLIVDVLGEEVEAISVIDSITVRLVHIGAMKENVQKVISRLIFAKNFGLVRFHDTDNETNFKLRRIFSDAWWMEYAR